MKTPAEKFRQNPAPVYRAADKGENVVIEHNHYKDKLFVLTAVDKPILSETTEIDGKEYLEKLKNGQGLMNTHIVDFADMQIDVKAITGPKEDRNEN